MYSSRSFSEVTLLLIPQPLLLLPLRIATVNCKPFHYYMYPTIVTIQGLHETSEATAMFCFVLFVLVSQISGTVHNT